MDFVAKEIFYLFWFSSMLGTIGAAINNPSPINQAVRNGARDVNITCGSSDKLGDVIKWTFTDVKNNEKTIKEANGIIKNKNYTGQASADGKTYTLFINEANYFTAGKYTCDDGGKYSVMLIVVEPTCGYSPNPTRTVPCDSPLMLSCDVEYYIDHAFFTPHLTWSVVPDTPMDRPTSVSLSKSTLNVTLLAEGKMPIYQCDVAFTLTDAIPGSNSLKAPIGSNGCQPFASADIVPCGQKDDPGDDDGKKGTTDTKEKSINSSVRSAETNNLAIRVLGVAGVLLLAQVL